MKNFLKLIILIFLTLLVFNKNSFSCDNLKNVKVGQDFSKSLEILYFIDGYNQEDFDEGVTAEYQSDTDEYCPKMGLENTILKVFIYDSKIAGLRIETWDIEVQENEIYNLYKSKYLKSRNITYFVLTGILSQILTLLSLLFLFKRLILRK